MVQVQTCRIQADAAKALAEWKAFFAEQVAQQAKALAKNDGSHDLITIDHYRQAALLALQALASAVQNTGLNNDRREVA